MRGKSAVTKVWSMFYRVTVLAVLLFGSEIWNLSPSVIKVMKGFHVRAARQMAGILPTKYQNRGD